MVMLGNDVIERPLAAAQSDWRRKNYLAKIFNAREIELVHCATDPDVVVWLIWSMKEAAYKVVNRITGLRFYDPLAFSCSFHMDEQSANGRVSYKKELYLTSTQITVGRVHTIAVGQGISISEVQVIHGVNEPAYTERFNVDNTHLSLSRDKGNLPILYDHRSKINSLASISHHGNSLAVAFFKSWYGPT